MKKVFASLMFAVLATGCVVRGSGYVTTPGVYVESEPPAPRYVEYSPRAGYIWVDGRWDYRGGQWVWADGYYERERVGYTYYPGYWDRRGSGHVWISGDWRSGGSGGVYGGGRGGGNYNSQPTVRDHRNNGGGGYRQPAQQPTVRDHRH